MKKKQPKSKAKLKPIKAKATQKSKGKLLKSKLQKKAKTARKSLLGLNEKTHIIAVIDKSGSMFAVAEAAINGFNEFLNKQKSIKGKATMDLILFSDFNKIDRVYENKNIQDVPELNSQTYITDGYTALHDAIGSSIKKFNTYQQSLTKAKRPEKVLMIIITDGKNNDSREFTDLDLLKGTINKLKNDNWQFLFLCSTEDAIMTGLNLGMSRGNTMQFTNTNEGNTNLYAAVADAAISFRSTSVSSRSFDKLSNNLLAEDDEQQ
jgi:Mg-chelatase subunit ChlD